MKTHASVIFFVFLIGCSGAIQETKRIENIQSTYNTAVEFSKLPDENISSDTGKSNPILSGDIAQYDGILVDEEKAAAIAKLKIDYVELYGISSINQKYLLTIIKMQSNSIYKSDCKIAELENKLDMETNSWWQKNKLIIGISSGLVIGIAGAIATGVVWSKIDN